MEQYRVTIETLEAPAHLAEPKTRVFECTSLLCICSCIAQEDIGAGMRAMDVSAIGNISVVADMLLAFLDNMPDGLRGELAQSILAKRLYEEKQRLDRVRQGVPLGDEQVERAELEQLVSELVSKAAGGRAQ